uniref:Probable DNA polymerase n=1 Tax=Termitomyces sp. K1Ag TaxID=1075695 RepID=A0A8F1D636_9AGAR|nr:DNA polymerase [Termitomyces sp. K1Ag]
MRKSKLITFNKWQDYYYKLKNQILESHHIRSALTSLFNHINNHISFDFDPIFIIQFKIKIDTNQIRSISFVQTVKFSEFNDLLLIFIEFWNIKDITYFSLKPSDIIFTYKILGKEPYGDLIKKSKLNRMRSIKKNSNFYFKGYNLPCTMDYSKWGKIISECDTFAIVKKVNSSLIYHIKITNRELRVEVKFKDKTILEFTDILLEKGKLNSFIRTIKKQEYIFIDGKLIVKKVKKETKFLQPIFHQESISRDFLTMDLETRTIDGVMTPYSISICDGEDTTSFYLSDFKTANEMLKSAIISIMKPKYHDYKVFIHNFSYFDGIFLLRILSELTDIVIKPIIRDGRIINLKFSFSILKYKFNLYFRDSYLLLPFSLKELAFNFDVTAKGIFPYKFVNNKNLSLDYIGKIPEYEYFDNLSLQDYNQYCEGFKKESWDLRKETIKYCNQDVITLYLVMDKFQKKIFTLFRIDVLKYPTLSSLSFAIYRSGYLKNFKIPLIEGNLFTDIKKGYSGGMVDVYKPFPDKGVKIYRYDVNSLYPSVMKNDNMPVGDPIYFEGDISLISIGTGYDLITNPFGFFEVEVTAPKSIRIPLLQTRIETENGIRTVAPLGTWKGTYFSEEINNAIKYGYKFKIIRGYLFEKQKIFSEFVDYIYKLKVNSKRGTPDYIISKLLLNSLYGRFGMNPEMENHIITSEKDSLLIINKKIVTNIIDLKNGKELISFFDSQDWDQEKAKKSLNISVPIAAAVTAAARIYMAKFKTMKDIELFYTDTDSIDINKPLPSQYVGEELGQMKLEHIFNEVIFLAPKVYGGKTDSYEYVKIKGLKNPITFDEMKPLLFKNQKVEINQEKWYRNISSGNINIKQEIYTLMINNFKRKLIYNDQNKFIDTIPLYLNGDKLD